LTMMLVSLVAVPLSGQWLNYPTPGTPRLPDGTVNLSAPAPRTPEGRPDLTGVWSGAGPMYRFNIAQDLGPGDVKPWAEALFLQRLRDSRKDSPLARCLPVSVPYHNFFNLTQFVQTPAVLVMRYESPNSPHRVIYTDGRPLPVDPNPTWLGYSIGRWEGDTLVIDTSGYNDKSWLSLTGIPHTEKLHTVEHIRRPDFGHIEVEIVMEDSEAFTGPWKRTFTATLASADEEIMEFICGENNRDPNHYRE